MEEDGIKKRVMEQFGKNAEKYVQSESHAKGDDLSLLIEWIQPKSNWIALDIATGGGHVSKALSPHVAHVFSTDITKEMLANTKIHLNQSFKNIWYVVADAESLPFLEDTFELVTCRIAPHHFPNPKKFVQEVKRVLKPNGLFLMIDNIVPENNDLADFMNTLEKLRDKSHVRCLSVTEWRNIFSQAGLSEVKSRHRKKIYNFPDWVERTVDSVKQISEVYDYIFNASKEIHEYFHVSFHNIEIHSMQVDEWMVLCRN